MVEPEHRPQKGRFDTAHLRAIHRHIFQGIFDWAGEFRTVKISKSGMPFAFSDRIAPALEKTFADLHCEALLTGIEPERFAARAAYYMGELNAVHPFREGNGRTQREFIREFAVRNGWTSTGQQYRSNK